MASAQNNHAQNNPPVRGDVRAIPEETAQDAEPTRSACNGTPRLS